VVRPPLAFLSNIRASRAVRALVCVIRSGLRIGCQFICSNLIVLHLLVCFGNSRTSLVSLQRELKICLFRSLRLLLLHLCFCVNCRSTLLCLAFSHPRFHSCFASGFAVEEFVPVFAATTEFVFVLELWPDGELSSRPKPPFGESGTVRFLRGCRAMTRANSKHKTAQQQCKSLL